MKILSIDQSLNSSGICIWEDGLLIDFKAIQPSKGLDQHIRLSLLLDEVEQLILEEKIEYLVLEGMSFSSSGISLRVLGAVYYSLLILCYKHGIEFQEIPPTTLKKFATGSGKAKKKDMWDNLPEEIKSKIESKNKTIKSGKHDICDSYWLGVFYLRNA